MVPRVLAVRLIAALAALALAACASTSLVGEWANDQFAGKPFRKVLVVGVIADDTVRRLYEDEFVQQAKARGLEAVQSYRFIPESGRADEAKLKQAVAQAGAEAIVLSSVKKVDRETVVSPGYVAPAPVYGFGYYRPYAGMWASTYYFPPTVQTYDVVVVETRMYDVKTGDLAWSGLTETFAPGKAKDEIPPFVKLILDSLAARKLV